MVSNYNLVLVLHHNVPRFIKHILSRGGVSDDEWQWLQSEQETPDCFQGFLARADEYLLYPKDEETYRQGLFALVLGLAIMAFASGGVRFCGLHFYKELENFVVVEDEAEAGLHGAKIWKAISAREGQ